jgi:hypothetical protein
MIEQPGQVTGNWSPYRAKSPATRQIDANRARATGETGEVTDYP